ncbi:MAG: 30S ribosomal protein S9 [Patescibacteria group bacterium]|nr:30S ribosomal protein S9 [Patescibacteria group bacterium]MDD4610533.1 30S ribosomal protein S9 [Patescibacteria group bacterium]
MTEEKNTTNKIVENNEEAIKFKGKYIRAIGSRKTASAEVRIYQNGKGMIAVNGLPAKKYFTADHIAILSQSLKLTGQQRDFDISIIVHGGGKKAQAEAARLGISRILIAMNKEIKLVLRAKDLVTRDARKKERKKPGLKKARRAPQWSKR